MTLKKIKNFLLEIILGASFCLTGCGAIDNGGGNGKSTQPKTVVTLTEAGAERINSLVDKKTNSAAKLSKYSSWLSRADLVETDEKVKAGDEVTEDMTFEIYPSDNLDSMFLVGRTNKPQTRGLLKAAAVETVEPLVNITTNIPADEINDYSLNGQISYINGSGDVNHDKFQLDEIPYQTDTELTMTYTYIKKGTAADTSPYSCQPSFHITKIDNEAPKSTESEFYCEISYTKNVSEIRSILIDYLDSKFITNDSSLTKVITILKTDEELLSIKSNAVETAIASETHVFPVNFVPFKISTENASTEELNLSLRFIDDVAPALKKNGGFTDKLILNGGTALKLPHIDVLNAGANELLKQVGYSVVDDIEGEVDLVEFDITSDGYLKTSFSYNRETKEFIDETTKFIWEDPSNEIIGEEVFKYAHLRSNDCIKNYYCFDPYSNSHTVYINTVESMPENNERDVLIIDDLVINKDKVFEETLSPSKWIGPKAIGVNDILIINSFTDLELSISRFSYGLDIDNVYVYVNFDIITNKNIQMAFSDSTIIANHIYTSSLSYDKTISYFNDSGEYDETFMFKVEKGTLDQIHYNYSLEDFKANFGIYY